MAATVLCISYGLLSYAIITHSAPLNYDDSMYNEICTSSEIDSTSSTSNSCCIEYNEALAAAKRDWMENLQNMINQEIPASEMVDDAYENLRTYNCWLEYICLSVEYSGIAPIESIQGTGLTSKQLGIVPGCQAPEDLRLGREYNTLLQSFKDVPIAGVSTDAIEQSYVDNQIAYFPSCQTDNNNQNPIIEQAKSQYDACKQALELQFGCTQAEADSEESTCLDHSTVFVEMENVLKKAHGEQKAAALENKLGQIVPKLQSMESHVGYLSNFLTQLNQRLACYAPYCQ